MAELAEAGITSFVLPKVESSDQIHELTSAVRRAGGSVEEVWAMIETAAGVLRADELAREAEAELSCLVLGTNDLVKDLGAHRTADGSTIRTAMQTVVLAARANGLACLDGVPAGVQADAAFDESAAMARSFGFDGKTLIHPSTIAPCNEAFSPSQEEVAAAARIVGAAAAADPDSGVVVVDGQLVEELHVEQAQKVLDLATRVALASSSSSSMARMQGDAEGQPTLHSRRHQAA